MDRPSFIARNVRDRWLIAFIVCVGFGLRLALTISPPQNFDHSSFETVARIMREGGNVYAHTQYYNYSPLWSYILAALDTLATALDVRMVVLERVFIAVADLGTFALIVLIAQQMGARNLPLVAAMYYLNPIAVHTTGLHGQFDTLAALPLLGAVLLAVRRPHAVPVLWVWLLCVMSLIIKHSLAFQVWMVFILLAPRIRDAVAWMVAAVGVFVLTFVPFWSTGYEGIINNVVFYQSIPIYYGLTYFLPRSLVALLFYVTMLGLPFAIRRWTRLGLVPALELSAVAMLVLNQGYGSQYLMIPLFFGVPTGNVWGPSLLFAATLPVALHSFAILSISAWVSLCCWLGSIVTRYGWLPPFHALLAAPRRIFGRTSA